MEEKIDPKQFGAPEDTEQSRVSRVMLTISTFAGFLERKGVIDLGKVDIRSLADEFIKEFVLQGKAN